MRRRQAPGAEGRVPAMYRSPEAQAGMASSLDRVAAYVSALAA